jgi:hypothetical protein
MGAEIGCARLESAQGSGCVSPPDPAPSQIPRAPNPVAVAGSQGPCSRVAQLGALEALEALGGRLGQSSEPVSSRLRMWIAA